jgi:hypothetical protein
VDTGPSARDRDDQNRREQSSLCWTACGALVGGAALPIVACQVIAGWGRSQDEPLALVGVLALGVLGAVPVGLYAGGLCRYLLWRRRERVRQAK